MKTLEQLEQLYPAFYWKPKQRVREKIISDQSMIISITNLIIIISSLIYLTIIYNTDAFAIFTRLSIILLSLTIFSIVIKRKILPIGKISRKKIRRMCEYLYLPERSPEYLQNSIKTKGEIIEDLENSIKKLKEYLIEIDFSDEQRLSGAQKIVIEREKENVHEAIKCDGERVQFLIKEIEYNRTLISFLEEILKK